MSFPPTPRPERLDELCLRFSNLEPITAKDVLDSCATRRPGPTRLAAVNTS